MDIDRELQAIIIEIKEGNREKAKELLHNFIKANPTNEKGWWIFARIAENIDQRIFCLQKVIDINPDYKDAQYQLERASGVSKNQFNPDKRYQEKGGKIKYPSFLKTHYCYSINYCCRVYNVYCIHEFHSTKIGQ